MADKQFARSGTSDFDISVDDPLAELARIVGYEEKPPVSVRDLEPAKPPVIARRKEPVFDLEDELMQAFENYDAPRFDPFRAVSARMAEQAALAAAEQAAAQHGADERPAETGVEEPAEPEVQPVQDYDPGVYEAVEDVSHAVADQPYPDDETADIAVDLEQELEMSIGYADDTDTAWDMREPSSLDVRPDDATAVVDHRYGEHAVFENDHPEAEAPEVETHDARVLENETALPLAAAGLAATGMSAAPVRAETKAAWTDIDELLEEVERFPVPPKSHDSKVSADSKVTGESQVAETRTVDPVAKPAAISQTADTVRKNNYPFTPTFGRATPVVSAGNATSSAFATPLAHNSTRPVDMPVQEPAAELLPVESRAEPVAEQSPAFEEAAVEETYARQVDVPVEARHDAPVAASGLVASDSAEAAVVAPAMEEPEFDLENFELDLSDIELDVDPAEFEMSSEEAFSERPQAAHAVFDPSEFEAAVEPVSEPLPFDPTMITQTDEVVHSIAEMNVPQLPVAETEPEYKSDYDLDLDSEIGQLYTDPTTGTDANEAASATGHMDFMSDPVWAAASQRVELKRRQDEDALDDFERALEEDFRRSLNEPRQQRGSPVDPDVSAANLNEMAYRGEGRRRQPLGLIALGLVALLAAGGGVYAFIGGSELASSDGPQIILADKTPTKIVPEEKGGKTVPNQDKAVYDRVAGNTNVDPSQKALVSSVEEPVDVVQRTLTPETLPLEGAEDDADATSAALAGETDDRLLPDGETANGNQADTQKPGVSPRKVRTMVVKPDGTLVAREETVTPEPQAELPVAAQDGAAQAVVAGNTTRSATPVTEQLAETPATATGEQAVAELRPIAETPEDATSALAEAADTTVEGTAPVRVVKTTKVGDQTPVPETRPVDQPVNVVGTVTDQGNVSNRVTPTPVADTQTAATATTETAANTQVAAANPGGYVIQIASLPSAADAQASYGNLSNKFASVIGGRGVDIRKADIPNKGTFFRVRVPAGSREEANALCARYKKAGGSCLVTK